MCSLSNLYDINAQVLLLFRYVVTTSSCASYTTFVHNSFRASFLSILSQPTSEIVRRAKKRRRSPGDFSKRRQRLISFQPSHTPTVTHADQYSLESGCWGVPLGSWSLDITPTTSRQESLFSFVTPLGNRRRVEEDSNLTNQSWWPSPGWVRTPFPTPCLPSAWLSSKITQMIVFHN